MSLNRWSGRGQAGEGKLALVFGLLILAGVIYFLKLAVPPRIQRGEIADYMERQGRAYVINQISQQQMIDSIIMEAQKLGLPVDESNLEVNDSQTRVSLTLTYDLSQTLIGGKVWVQHHEVSRELPRL